MWIYLLVANSLIYSLWNVLHIWKALIWAFQYNLVYGNWFYVYKNIVIRRVCGQTLARVRVRTDIDSSIIISLQLLWSISWGYSMELDEGYDDMIGYARVVSVSTSCSRCHNLMPSFLFPHALDSFVLWTKHCFIMYA